MRKSIWVFLFISVVMLLAACSASETESGSMEESKSSSSEDMATEAEVSNEIAEDSDSQMENVAPEEKQNESQEVATTRMIIHQAHLQVNVKKLETAQANITKKVEQYGGYIVESNVYQEDDDTNSGKMIVRIPEKHFQTFLKDAEGEAADILERNVTGQDVTEQYVDLQSRVKSKRAVEERLLEFMSNAQKTEDLLKISTDLAKVQEEIEVMVGKINYLENQTSFSTIELLMYENRVVIPNIESKELNTWEKTKKQLATSTNGLLAAGSAFLVFFIGNLPVLILLALIAVAVIWFVKRRRRTEAKK